MKWKTYFFIMILLLILIAVAEGYTFKSGTETIKVTSTDGSLYFIETKDPTENRDFWDKREKKEVKAILLFLGIVILMFV